MQLVGCDPAQMADALPADAWTPHAAGEGSKGLRLYDWARIAPGCGELVHFARPRDLDPELGPERMA